MQFRRLASSFVVLAGLLAGSAAALAADPENTMIITLKDGDVTVALRPDLAPKACGADQGAGSGGRLRQCRVPPRDRWFHGSDRRCGVRRHEGWLSTPRLPEPAVPSGRICPPNSRRSIMCAELSVWRARRTRTRPTRSSSSCLRLRPPLEGQYTVVGNVESGMELVDKIKKGDPAQNGVVSEPDRMVKVRIAADGN